MQFIFLIWPILLLPVFVTWLTRPRPVAPLPTRSSASHRATSPSPAARKPAQQLTAAERRRNSPAYRRAAVEAYETMLALEIDDHDENDFNASSHIVQLQGKDATSSRS